MLFHLFPLSASFLSLYVLSCPVKATRSAPAVNTLEKHEKCRGSMVAGSCKHSLNTSLPNIAMPAAPELSALFQRALIAQEWTSKTLERSMAPVLSASLKQGTHSYIHKVTYCFTNCVEMTASFWKGIAPKPTSAVICNSKHLYEEVGNVCCPPSKGCM